MDENMLFATEDQMYESGLAQAEESVDSKKFLIFQKCPLDILIFMYCLHVYICKG